MSDEQYSYYVQPFNRRIFKGNLKTCHASCAA